MANEIQFSSAVNVAAYIEAEIAEALRAQLVLTPLGRVVTFQQGSDSMKLRKKGTVAAGAGTESVAPSNTAYTQSSPATLQVQEAVVLFDRSDRSKFFSQLTTEEIIEAGAKAVAEKIESDGLALFDSFSNQVGTTTVDLTPQGMRQAAYTLRLNNNDGVYIYILHPTQVDNVNEDIIAGTGIGNVWANSNLELSILNQKAAGVNGFVGTFLGNEIRVTTLTESKNAAADWEGAIIVPNKALAFGQDGRGVQVEIDRQGASRSDDIIINAYYDWKEAEDLAGVGILSAQ